MMKTPGKHRGKTRRRQRGAALITALTFVALAAVLAGASVALSQTSAKVTKNLSERACAMYIAEGAASRAMWLVLKDIETNSNRSMSLAGQEDKTLSQEERFMADGQSHNFDYYGADASVSIRDAASGFDLSEMSATQALAVVRNVFTKDADQAAGLESFLAKLKDYADSDDFASSADGMERKDYAAKKLSPLPRNGRIRFREEIMIIPGIEDFFKTDEYGRLNDFRPALLDGMKRIPSQNSFYNAPDLLLRAKLSSTDPRNVDKIIESRDLWRKQGVPLSQSLDPSLMGALQGSFSFNESGVYTFVVKASSDKDTPSCSLVVTVELRKGALSGKKEINYYEWAFF
jgi:hypothetical protein